MLYRDFYCRLIVYGRRKKRDQWGQKRPTLRPKDDWITLAAENLRIVADEQWNAARERMAATRKSYLRDTKGKLNGRPANGALSKYLLTGLAGCGVCGGSLTVRVSNKLGLRHSYYHCLSNIQRGSSVCTNTIALPMREVDSRVLSMLEGQLLDPDVLADAIVQATKRIKGGNPVQQRAGLVRRLAAVKKEIENFTQAIAAAKDIPAWSRHSRSATRSGRASRLTWLGSTR